MKPIDIAIALMVMGIWGFNFVVVKVGVGDVPPILLVALRFMLVAAILLPFVAVPRDRMVPLFVLSVVFGTLHFGLMFSGVGGLDAGTAAVAIQLQVPFAAILGAVMLNDRPGWRRISGMVFAFAGVVVLSGEPRVQDNLAALVLVIAASFAWAVSNFMIKRLGPIDGFQLNAWVALFAVPQLLLSSWLLEEGQWDALTHLGWETVACLLYMAVLTTILGYGMWYRLIITYPVSQTIPFTLLVPGIGVLSGVLALGEEPTWRLLAGGLMTVIGVAVIVIRRPQTIDGNAPGQTS